MKFVVSMIAGLSITLAVAAPVSAGTMNGVEVASVKYASSKCKVPEPAGLLIRAIKSRAAFKQAVNAHNEYAKASEVYRQCRVDEFTADQKTLSEQVAADLQKNAEVNNQEVDDLKAKEKELK